MNKILISLLAGAWTLLLLFLSGADFSQRGFDLGYSLFVSTLIVGFVYALLGAWEKSK